MWKLIFLMWNLIFFSRKYVKYYLIVLLMAKEDTPATHYNAHLEEEED